MLRMFCYLDCWLVVHIECQIPFNLKPISCSSLHVQIISLPALHPATYSASVAERVTISWCLDIQETTPHMHLWSDQNPCNHHGLHQNKSRIAVSSRDLGNRWCQRLMILEYSEIGIWWHSSVLHQDLKWMKQADQLQMQCLVEWCKKDTAKSQLHPYSWQNS